MLLGSIQNIREESAFYPEALRAGLNFLATEDVQALSLGRHEICGDKVFALVSEYETQPRQERRPEAHKKYIDIQFICAGSELIAAAPLASAGEVDEDCLAARDVVYYRQAAEETDLVLMPGMFAVYFPWDVHRPNCSPGEQAQKVRKIVVKVAMAAL